MKDKTQEKMKDRKKKEEEEDEMILEEESDEDEGMEERSVETVEAQR